MLNRIEVGDLVFVLGHPGLFIVRQLLNDQSSPFSIPWPTMKPRLIAEVEVFRETNLLLRAHKRLLPPHKVVRVPLYFLTRFLVPQANPFPSPVA
jgi:hypothetical protein